MVSHNTGVRSEEAMSVMTDAEIVANFAQQVLPLKTAKLGEEYFYQSLPLCVIDAVYSISVKYAGVQNVVARYCNFTDQRRVRVDSKCPPTSKQESISAFCNRSGQSDPNEMAVRVYRNRQRTSVTNGILKADAVIQFARCLQSHEVEYFQDVHRIADNPRFDEDIKNIQGQGSGISLKYFLMLAGFDNLIKPDRMVLLFLESALSRRVKVVEASPLLSLACEQLKPRHEHLTPRLLDHEVWKYQREIKAAKAKCRI